MFYGEKFESVGEFIEELKEYIDYYNNDRIYRHIIKFCVKTIQPNTLVACPSSPPMDFLTATRLPEIGWSMHCFVRFPGIIHSQEIHLRRRSVAEHYAQPV